MRAAIVTVGCALVASALISATWIFLPPANAATSTGAAAIVATGVRAATASAADGSGRVELPWLLPGDTDPAVSPDGTRVAFSSARSGSTEIYVVEGSSGLVRQLTRNPAFDDLGPAWSPDGRRIVWASGPPRAHDLFVMRADCRISTSGHRAASSSCRKTAEYAWASRLPSTTSATARFGAHRPEPLHAASIADEHELASIGRPVRPGQTVSDLVVGPPVFVGDCGARRPQARRVDEGSSVGYTDRYPGFFHGQDIDITGLESGLYLLVHRANPERRIRELRYSNNVASALIRISKAAGSTGLPTARIVKRCHASDRCQAG